MTSANQGLKRAAHARVSCAYVFGELAHPVECERCGSKATSRTIYQHHDDYALPMDLIPLCGSCHVWRHTQLKSGKVTSRARLRETYQEAESAKFQSPSDTVNGAEVVAAFARLTPRQSEVMELIFFEGLENEEIATRLFLASSTVELHRVTACRALGQYLRLDRMHLRLATALWWKNIGLGRLKRVRSK
jgi:hypothetical protein